MNTTSMKKTSILFVLTLIAGFTAVFTGCVKKDFDVPPIVVPSVDFESNANIDTLKRLLSHPMIYDTLYVKDTIVGTSHMKKIISDLIIQGLVSANDESGNIYKSLYLQDSTSGIVIASDMTDMYTLYKVGQRIYIKCKGLYLGSYGGVAQLGWADPAYSVGRIPATQLESRLFPDSLAGKSPAADTLILPGDTTNLVQRVNKLVIIPNVRFEDAGQPFVTGDATTNRNITDATGNVIMIGGKSLILRTSNYASFSLSNLPLGIGAVRGILSSYSKQYQLYIRDLNDLINFDTTGAGPVLTTIYENSFDVDPPDWVKYSVNGNNWTFDSQYQVMVGNGYGGTEPSDCYLVSPALQLTGVSEPILSFRMWTKYTDSGNPNPFEVLISTNYTGSGDPTLATWTTVTCTIPAANSAAWTSSGDVDLSAYNQKVYIAFHYKSSGTASSTASKWEVDNFKLTGKQ